MSEAYFGLPEKSGEAGLEILRRFTLS